MMPLADLWAAMRWWAVLAVIGAAALPLTFTVLRWLPDRGYAFARMVGLLLTSYLFWLLGSLGFLANETGSILFALFLVAAASFVAYRRSEGGLRFWLRDQRRYVIAAELLFAVLFFLWTWVRAQNPMIFATEKPMEFAFLNAAGRSATFPPVDPWLSGFGISYYYFGYVMISVLTRLAVVPEFIGFNLGIAWLVAATGLGAFGLVYNLVAAGQTNTVRRFAIVLALVAGIAIPVAGNLEIGLEILHANGVGPDRFWAWLDIRDLQPPAVAQEVPRYETSDWWWWRSSRVIHEYHLPGRAEHGLEPIAEVPAFSFMLGDMHPHVLALPYAFVSLAIAFVWWLRPAVSLDPAAPYWRRVHQVIAHYGWPFWLLTVLVIGGLSFLNTWDVLIHLFVVAGAVVLAQWRDEGHWRYGFMAHGVLVGASMALFAVLLYLPFYLGFRSQAGAPYLLPMLMQPTRLSHFLIIFGMPLLVLVIFTIILLSHRRQSAWHAGLLVPLGLILTLSLLMLVLGWIIAAAPQSGGLVTQLATELGLDLPPPPAGFAPVWALSAVAALLPTLLAARLGSPWLVLFLASMLGAAVMLWHGVLNRRDEETSPEKTLPFALLLLVTGLLLTLGPEFVYLRDVFGQRINTIFKFYYQAWLLFCVTAVYGLAYLWQRARRAALLTSTVYGLLLLVALSFPYFAVSSRAGEYAATPSLDGIGFYTSDEREAVLWLRNNLEGTPVVLEAVHPDGGQYSDFARISASTGLPTVLGWVGHEHQWRGSTEETSVRKPAVELIYTRRDWTQTVEALNKYDVSYVYVGPRELATYGSVAHDKFVGRLEVAFANNTVTIYQWLPGAETASSLP
jgi:YYY domain-containing protein